eukprot:6184819-Pleurochrysis_carterae.AAC.3
MNQLSALRAIPRWHAEQVLESIKVVVHDEWQAGGMEKELNMRRLQQGRSLKLLLDTVLQSGTVARGKI